MMTFVPSAGTKHHNLNNKVNYRLKFYGNPEILFILLSQFSLVVLKPSSLSELETRGDMSMLSIRVKKRHPVAQLFTVSWA